MPLVPDRPALAAQLETRIRSFLGEELGRRLVVYPGLLDGKAWRALLLSADCLLESFPYGGFTTSLEAFRLGRPVVTMPHPTRLGGRHTFGMLRKMGLSQGLVAR